MQEMLAMYDLTDPCFSNILWRGSKQLTTSIDMKVFLSYSSEDQEAAQELASQLAKAGLDVWDPAEALFPGDNWPLGIGKALEESTAMVVLISPESVKSDSVQHNLQYALSAPQYKGRVIPVLVRPTKDIPWVLKKFPIVRIGHDLREAVRQIAEYVKRGFALTPASA